MRRLVWARVTAYHEVCLSFLGIVTVDGQIDFLHSTMEEAILREPDPEVAQGGAPPRACPVAEANVVVDLFVVKDKGAIQEVVRVKRTAPELGGPSGIEDDAGTIEASPVRSLDLVEAGLFRRQGGVAPRCPER